MVPSERFIFQLPLLKWILWSCGEILTNMATRLTLQLQLFNNIPREVYLCACALPHWTSWIIVDTLARLCTARHATEELTQFAHLLFGTWTFHFCPVRNLPDCVYSSRQGRVPPLQPAGIKTLTQGLPDTLHSTIGNTASASIACFFLFFFK